MAVKKQTLRASEEHRGKRLDQVLADWLPQALGQPVSKAKVRKLVVAGAVYLNGKRVRIASKELLPGAKIDAYIDSVKLFETDGPSHDQAFEMTAAYILFEDEFLIAVNKPAGLPTQPTLDEARVNLFAAVKKFIAARDGAAQTYVGLHHRLDRDTSGVVLFTKKTEANAGTADLFSKHLAQKTYNALSWVPPRERLESKWTVKNFLGKAPGGGKRARFTAVRSGGDSAHTDFRLLGQFDKIAWIEAMPRTGRTHQIRVHLSEAGLPILSDPVYGIREDNPPFAPRLMLHARQLDFPHPITGKSVRIESPLPEDFQQCLDRLKKR